jgi:hypothetical protein
MIANTQKTHQYIATWFRSNLVKDYQIQVHPCKEAENDNKMIKFHNSYKQSLLLRQPPLEV